MPLTKQIMQNYSLSIRAELGYPLYAPANHSMAFAAGRKFDFAVGIDLARHAEMGGKDFVYSGWASVEDDAPCDHTLIIRQQLSIDILPGISFWAADDRAPVVIVAKEQDRYFELDDRLNLQQRIGRPGRKMLQGERRATERILRGAELMEGITLDGNAWVPNGGDWVPPAAPHANVVQFR